MSKDGRSHSFTAWFTFQGEDYLKPFDNYFEACEWCCILIEYVGGRKERFARAKVERGGGVVWEYQRHTERKNCQFPLISQSDDYRRRNHH